jgi:hypothetical protein
MSHPRQLPLVRWGKVCSATPTKERLQWLQGSEMDSMGTTFFYAGWPGRTVQVQTVRVDSVVQEHVALLKTDTQGHELHVLPPAQHRRSSILLPTVARLNGRSLAAFIAHTQTVLVGGAGSSKSAAVGHRKRFREDFVLSSCGRFVQVLMGAEGLLRKHGVDILLVEFAPRLLMANGRSSASLHALPCAGCCLTPMLRCRRGPRRLAQLHL